MTPTSDIKWLYLDVNSYFASVEQQIEPALRGRPVAVVPVMTDSTCAIAASYEAKAFGVKTGMPIWEVKKLCPDIRLVAARHDLYVRFHHRIVEEIEKHVPVTKVLSIDEVACALIGSERIRDNAIELGRKIKRGLIEKVGECLYCSVGVAPNRLLAKIACNFQKPDGLTAIELHELPDKLLALDLRDLPGIGANMERRLHRAGIDSIAALWAIAPKHARKIWGSVTGERFWYDLHGVDLPERETVRRSIGHARVLAPDCRQPDRARLVARRLTLKASSRLRRLGYLAAALGLQVKLENNSRWDGELRLYQCQDTFTLLGGLERLWQDFANRHGIARVKRVAVTLCRLTPISAAVADLFGAGPNAPEGDNNRRTKLSAAMDRINHRYGRDMVSFGKLPRNGMDFIGAKVAFTRIPALAEFCE